MRAGVVKENTAIITLYVGSMEIHYTFFNRKTLFLLCIWPQKPMHTIIVVNMFPMLKQEKNWQQILGFWEGLKILWTDMQQSSHNKLLLQLYFKDVETIHSFLVCMRQ